MLKPQRETFDSRDRNGEPCSVEYMTEPLPFSEGYKLGLELAGVMTPILGSAAGSLFGVDSVDDEVSFTEAGAELGRLPQRLLELGDWRLIGRILAKTCQIHDGKKSGYLSSDLELTKAFAGGNYGEAAKVLWWVLGVNYAPFGMDAESAWGGLLEKLRGLVSLDSLTALMATSDEEPSKSSSALSVAEDA
jgi:hypothetical protein